jgi:hypothetical protein
MIAATGKTDGTVIGLVIAMPIARLAGRLGAAPSGIGLPHSARPGRHVCFTAAAHFNSMRSDMIRMRGSGEVTCR